MLLPISPNSYTVFLSQCTNDLCCQCRLGAAVTPHLFYQTVQFDAGLRIRCNCDTQDVRNFNPTLSLLASNHTIWLWVEFGILFTLRILLLMLEFCFPLPTTSQWCNILLKDHIASIISTDMMTLYKKGKLSKESMHRILQGYPPLVIWQPTLILRSFTSILGELVNS